MPEVNPALSEEKTIPIDDTGDPVDVNLEDKKEEKEETPVVESSSEASSEHEEYQGTVKKRIDSLTKKWREEERQKEAALKYAQSVKKENETLQQKFNNLDDSYIGEVEARVNATEMALKRALAEAHQKGDFDAVADIQSKLSDNSVAKQRVANAKGKKPEAKETPVDTPQNDLPASVVAGTPNVKPSKKAIDWAAKNPWFGQGEGKDIVKTYAVWGIHTELANEGFDLESDEYYNEIDTRLQAKFSDNMQNNSNSYSTNSRPAQTVASATNSRVGRSGRRTVKLTPSQVAIAKKLGVPLEEYAKHVKE